MFHKIRGSWLTKCLRAQKTSGYLFHRKIYSDQEESPKVTTNLDFLSKYDEQSTQRILNVLNETSFEELTRYNISKGRLQKVEKYRKVNGPFKTIEQVLEVNDFGAKVLEKFVTSIVEGPTTKTIVREPRIPQKLIDEVSTPVLTSERRNLINTITSVAFGPKHVSWAKMEANGHLLTWDTFRQYPWPRRDDPMRLHELALIIQDKLPKSDVYVTELPPVSQLSTAQHNVPGLFNDQRLQLSAMIATLLASQLNDTEEIDAPMWTSRDNFYFLRRNLPARLFQLMIGDEVVSARAVINQIIEKEFSKSLEHIALITVDVPEVEEYDRSGELKKEALGQALLCSATFSILAMQQDISSFQSLGRINFRKRTKEDF